jgi:hypothetical protein
VEIIPRRVIKFLAFLADITLRGDMTNVIGIRKEEAAKKDVVNSITGGIPRNARGVT